MSRVRMVTCSLIVGLIGSTVSIAVHSQTRPASNTVVYEGARLIIGDASAPIEGGAFVVQNGRITAVGRKGQVAVPSGASRVDLTGKTVMPTMVDAHTHFGYERFASFAGDARPENYTPDNLLDHFQREAFYGVGTVNDGGSASVPISLRFQVDQAARNFPPAAQYVFAAGIVPPNGGPDTVLIKGTRPLHANYEVLLAPEARAAVQDVAAKSIPRVKIWVGDRNGTYPAMPREVYEAVIDEAHKRNIKVHAHASNFRDQKDILVAGADLIVHSVAAARIEDELLGVIRNKKPYWVLIVGSGDRSELCDNDQFTAQLLSPRIVADVQANRCTTNAPARDEVLRYNVGKMVEAGARLVLGTDAGIRPGYSFGSADHHELVAYVRLGLTPAQAIMAATSTAAEALDLKDVGVLAQGKTADFIVLNANPLDDIRNTRQIASVYLRGAMLDRQAMLARWQQMNRTN